MLYFILAIHILLCLVLIGLVLLQQGKGASVGAILSGSSNTLLGATGANNLLVKMTTGIAVSFMITSLILIKMYGNASLSSSTDTGLSGRVLNTLVQENAPKVDTESSKTEGGNTAAAPANVPAAVPPPVAASDSKEQ